MAVRCMLVLGVFLIVATHSLGVPKGMQIGYENIRHKYEPHLLLIRFVKVSSAVCQWKTS